MASDDEKEYIDFIINYSCGVGKITLLWCAAVKWNYKAVEYLVSLGADVNEQTPNTKCTALWSVCHDKLKEGCEEEGRKIAKLLLDKGAKVDITDFSGVALYNKNTDFEIKK